MCILENAAIRDGGKILCESTYTLEGDEPLVLFEYEIFKKIDGHFENDPETTHTNLIVEEVYEMLDLIYRPRLNNLNDIREACQTLQLDIESKENEIHNIPHPGNPRRGRVIVIHNYSYMVGRRPIQIDSDECNTLNQELKPLKDTLIKEKQLLVDQQKYIDNWVYPISRNDIKDYAREVVVKPAVDY